MSFFETRRGAATLSVMACAGLTLLKLAACARTQSVGLFSEALHSGVDLLAAGIAFVAVRKAEAPADARYPFGRGKWESLSGAVEGLLILFAAALIAREAWEKIAHPVLPVEIPLGLAVLGISVAVNLFAGAHIQRIGRRERSTALLVDAAHLQSDVVSSLGVLVGLALVHWTRQPALDAVAGIFVGLLVLRAAWRALRASASELLDHGLPEEEAVVRRILDAHYPQYLSYHDIRSRRTGRRSHFEVHLVMAGDQTVERAHDFCDHLELDIREALGDVHIAIHVEPPSERDPASRDQRRRPRVPETAGPEAILGRELPGRLPAAVLEILRTLRAAGHRGYLVGGAVRDVLLARPFPVDWDIATDAHPDEVLALYPDSVLVGLKHGTVGVHADGRIAEVTTFRSEGGYSDARRPDDIRFHKSLEEDLSRRDFTVNAMAFDPLDGSFVDPFEGWNDLKAGMLRAVGDPELRLREDGLRALRAARFAAQLDFALAEPTLEAIRPARDRVARVAIERVREELHRLVLSEHPRRGFALLDRTGLLEDLLPELAEARGVYQNRYHAYDVYGHSLATLENAPREKPRVRWAALLHDIGKPRTRALKGGEGTFYNHQHVGADLADALLRRLKFGTVERETIVHLVREHMFDYRSQWTDAALRRFVRRVGREHLADLFDLRIADTLGNGLKQGFPHYLEEMHARVEELLARDVALSARDLALGGEEIMRVLEIPAGPRVGAAQHYLLEAVLDDPARNTPEALELLLREARETLRQA